MDGAYRNVLILANFSSCSKCPLVPFHRSRTADTPADGSKIRGRIEADGIPGGRWGRRRGTWRSNSVPGRKRRGASGAGLSTSGPLFFPPSQAAIRGDGTRTSRAPSMLLIRREAARQEACGYERVQGRVQEKRRRPR